MTPTKIKLYMAPDTCARVTLTALEEIGCEYEFHTIAFLAGEHLSPEYLDINPTGSVPTLDVDGTILTQNSAILKYLAETFPDASLLPQTQTSLERWEINSLFAWLSADIHQNLGPMRFPFLITDMPEAFENVGEKAAERITRKMSWMNERLTKQPWVLGDSWSILDAYLSWAWFRTVGSQISKETFPAIEQMSQRHYSRPASLRVSKIEETEIAKLSAKGLWAAPKA